MALWKTIAKNELKLRTNKFRNHRKLFFISLYSFFIIWAFLLAPWLFDLFMPTIVAAIPPITIKFAVALVIEYVMMAFFLSVFIYPLNSVYRKIEIGFKEIILASPASSGDIFLGEFLGKLPVYFGGILLFTPIIIGMINPIINLSTIQYLIIYLCIFGLILFATLLGSIVASWLERKIAKSERARDLGKILLFLLSIAMVAIMYTLQFLFKFLMDNPQLRNWVMFYPSLWFSNIVLYFIDPILISSYILNVWSSLALMIIIPLIIFLIAYKKADNFFTVEGGIEKITTVIERENKFYLLIRKTTGHKWRGLIITQLKEFLRKRESIMKFAYLLGLVGVLGIVFSNFALDNFLAESILIVLLIVTGGIMYGLLFGSYIFVGSKDLIWVYKRSPRNIRALVYSYLLAMLIFNVLMALGITIFFTYFLEFDLFTIIFFFSFYLINSEVVIAQAVGIQCLSPAFEEKGSSMTTNNLILMVLQFVPFQFIFPFMIIAFPIPSSPELVKLYFLMPLLLISIVSAILLLTFGLKKLGKIE
ncbi:MAG: hypothetical protein JSV23_02340 [Promethearchaeota archaeon]|nr:MAG: hypothetical protein JSV23_02340 [Candidatus Lokiarchaeota archaeon]